jgi:hypothetical protein
MVNMTPTVIMRERRASPLSLSLSVVCDLQIILLKLSEKFNLEQLHTITMPLHLQKILRKHHQHHLAHLTKRPTSGLTNHHTLYIFTHQNAKNNINFHFHNPYVKRV